MADISKERRRQMDAALIRAVDLAADVVRVTPSWGSREGDDFVDLKVRRRTEAVAKAVGRYNEEEGRFGVRIFLSFVEPYYPPSTPSRES
jgi:hypothetical protein